MYLVDVDESGDVGSKMGSSRYFALSGLVVHELRWHDALDSIIAFRRRARAKDGLKLREEIHANHFIHRPGNLARIAKSMRLRLLRDVVDFQAGLPHVSILNVLIDKEGKPADYDIFQSAWRALIQRFENTISQRNFAGPRNAQDLGLLVVDQTEEAGLRNLTRKMRVYNPVPNMGGAYFLYQMHAPAGYVRKKGARHYFARLDPALCKVASLTDAQGIVRL